MGSSDDNGAVLRIDTLEPAQRRRQLVRSMLISGGVITMLVVAYFVAPWDGGRGGTVVVRLVVALVVFAIAAVASVRSVLEARHPMLRAVEALVGLVAFAIVAFAATYLLMSTGDDGAFSEPLSHVDALYFSLTTATTVGYGDINAKTEAARVVVMLQMLVNVVVVGASARVLLGAARRRAGTA